MSSSISQSEPSSEQKQNHGKDLEKQGEEQKLSCKQIFCDAVVIVPYMLGWFGMVYHFWSLVVTPLIFAAGTAAWLILDAIIMYCVHKKGMKFGGVDERFFDIFNIPHFMFGGVMSMSGVPLVYTLAAAIVWEYVEIFTVGIGEHESPVNRAGDIIMALGAWFLVRALTVHSYQLL
jgi:hypothetical protein